MLTGVQTWRNLSGGSVPDAVGASVGRAVVGRSDAYRRSDVGRNLSGGGSMRSGHRGECVPWWVGLWWCSDAYRRSDVGTTFRAVVLDAVGILSGVPWAVL